MRTFRYCAGRRWVELLDRAEETWLPDVLRARASNGSSGTGYRSSAVVVCVPRGGA